MTCLVTAVHGLLLKKIDSNCSDKFLAAVQQSGCEDKLIKARPAVTMRWLASFWVNVCAPHKTLSNVNYLKLANATSYKAWLTSFEELLLSTVKENNLPKVMPRMPAFYTFE